MIKRGLIAGLVSVGVNILDNQGMPVPITRHSIRANNAVGGIHVRLSPDQRNIALVEIFDKSGINISSAMQRKSRASFIEKIGDERILTVSDISTMCPAPLSNIHRISSGNLILRSSQSVISEWLWITHTDQYRTFSKNARQLELETIALNAYTDSKKAPRKSESRETLIKTLSEIVLTLHADIGVAAYGRRRANGGRG